MSSSRIFLHAIAIAGLAMASACAPAGQSRSGQPMAGWYVQRGADATFQPCGAAHLLGVVNGAELRRRATDFGLQDGDPVYVQLSGSRRDGEFHLSRIEQFGSPAPVRDCPMTGTMIQG